MIRLKIIAQMILCICVTSLYSQEIDFKVASIPQNITENANSVVLFRDYLIEIHSQDLMTIKVKTAITVLNKLGDENRYVNVFFDDNQKLKH